MRRFDHGRTAPAAPPHCAGCRLLRSDRDALEELHRRSIEQPETFRAEEAQAVRWRGPPRRILDYAKPPFRAWLAGGETNLCGNAVDRHLAARPDQQALVAVSTETGVTRSVTSSIAW